MLRRATLICALAVPLLCGCATARDPGQGGEVRSAQPHVVARASPRDAALLRDGNAAFAGRLLAVLARGDGNVAFSPFTISQAMAMTFAGARGATAAQFEAALDFRLPAARLHPSFDAVGESLARAAGPGTILDVANALFGQRGEPFRGPFLNLLARDYGAGMHTVNFEKATESARQTINGWVADHTHGHIAQLIGPGILDWFTRLVLVDAVYLHARWAQPFQQPATGAAPFHAAEGTIEVPTMHQQGEFAYRRVPAGYQAVELPYSGGRLVFDVLLPDPGRLSRLLARLAADGPLAQLRGLTERPIDLALPKVKIRTTVNLRGALSALGMPLAFSDRADLSGIELPARYLHLRAVIHQAYIRVDEAGTEAAAATAAVAVASAGLFPPPLPVHVDRPFVFVLRDRVTGAILFTGVVREPQATG